MSQFIVQMKRFVNVQNILKLEFECEKSSFTVIHAYNAEKPSN